MLGKNLELNEHTMGIIKEVGRHMPGGFFVYKAEGDEELIYANDAVIALFGCHDLDEFKELTGYTFKGMLHPDDYAAVSNSVHDQVRMDNQHNDHAENGKLVVDMFSTSESGYYAAILMDVRMPVMDGLEAAERIRALDRTDAGRIPIIALTANAFDEDVQRSLQAGMNAHLSKPVEPEHLYQTLEELIWESEQKKEGSV